MPYVFTCAKCGKSISLFNGDSFRQVVVEKNGKKEIKYIHLIPNCNEVHRTFRLILGGQDG